MNKPERAAAQRLPPSSLKVGFLTARWSSVNNGEVWTEAGVARIVNLLAERYSELHLAMAVSHDKLALHDHPVRLPRGEFHRLPWLPSVVGGLRKGWAVSQVVRALEQRCDVVLVQLPFAAVQALWPVRRPRVYHLCADIVQIVDTSPYYQGRLKYPARGLARAIDFVEARLCARSDARIVANGADLFARFGGANKGAELVSATLLERDVQSVPRRRAAGAFRLLFVGYLRHEKGFGTLLEACRQLPERPGGWELAIVGAPHSDDRGVTDDLRQGLKSLEGKVKVIFEGFKPFGPALFQCYADADVLLLPSLSEGTPRVLIEARAFECPVVASRVGGIPSSVTDGVDGLLVPPGDAKALAGAITRLENSPPLRATLVTQGLARARRHTVEAMVGTMAGEIEKAAATR
ncbi:MAG: glycosyltransferase [Myxococcaceae bacterium]|nr:glycosyltransferase [Myxococcaceae bacterium]